MVNSKNCSSPFTIYYLPLFYPPSAQDFVYAVEDRGLARCDGALRLIEEDVCAVAFEHGDCGRSGRVAVANAHLCAHGFMRRVERNPVDARGCKFAAQQLLLRADYDAILR